MPTAYILVGLPGVGKSTWLREYHPELRVASSDAYIECMARSVGKTYNEVFEQHIKRAQTLVWENIDNFVMEGVSFAVDQTNLRKGKRKAILDKIPTNWRRIAVVFEQPSPAIHNERLDSRPGKIIPESVLSSMANSYERLEFSEGFNEIHYVRTW